MHSVLNRLLIVKAKGIEKTKKSNIPDGVFEPVEDATPNIGAAALLHAAATPPAGHAHHQPKNPLHPHQGVQQVRHLQPWH